MLLSKEEMDEQINRHKEQLKERIAMLDTQTVDIQLNDVPSHYGRLNIMPIEVMEDTFSSEAYVGFCLGNIIKYAMRLGHKTGNTKLEEARKIRTYADFLVRHLEEN